MNWNINESTAEFHLDHWGGSLKLSNPEQGLAITAPNGAKLSDLLGVFFLKPNLPSHQDCYARQGDLIAVYPPREPRKFHVQLDYRLLESTEASLLVELWISVQTYLLDNHPVVSVVCPLQTRNACLYDENTSRTLMKVALSSEPTSSRETSQEQSKLAAISGPITDEDLFVAWFNHPRDQFDTLWLLADDRPRIEARLFGHFMEKGVIRRGRMRCLVSLNELPPSQLQKFYQDFAASPLPLTA